MSFETPENMDKYCNTCSWNEPFNSVCCNADSPHCADFLDDGCDELEGGTNGFVQEVGWQSIRATECKRYLLNNCIDGHCSGCGECCADLLPLTKGEIKRLRDYARKHHLQENKRSFLETKGGPDLSCPFRNEHTKQCDVYSVRPLICKEYICSRLFQKPIAKTGLTKEKRDIHSLRWGFSRTRNVKIC